MSIYEQRDTPAYRDLAIGPECSRNPHILAWWSAAHDALIVDLIKKWQWMWYWQVTEGVEKITPPDVLDAWKKSDPGCRGRAWYNNIMYFAHSRAEVLGLTNTIRAPIVKVCPLCKNNFVESSLPEPIVERLGIDGLDFCSPCLQSAIFQGTGSSTLSRDEVITYLKELSDVLQQVPQQGYGEGSDDLEYMSKEERYRVVQLLRRKPSVKRVKELFGSWLKALIESGVLEDGTRKTSRGTQCIARDGHVCFSLAEKTIDDYLFIHNIPHEKEPSYPASGMRADFLVNSVLIEYFGLRGDPLYDKKINLKQSMCEESGIALISLYSEDIVTIKKLEKKLSLILEARQEKEI